MIHNNTYVFLSPPEKNHKYFPMLILDNFLPEDDFKELQKIIMANQFPWFYLENVSIPPEDGITIKDNHAVETDGFFHVMYDRSYTANSFTHAIMEKFYRVLEEKVGLTSDRLIRSRLSMKLPKIGFNCENYNLPHVDYYFPHETLIYYINECDGDTRMFNEWFTPQAEGVPIEVPDTFTVQQRIPPKANRLVLFNGLQFHTASNPLNSQRRVIININYESR